MKTEYKVSPRLVAFIIAFSIGFNGSAQSLPHVATGTIKRVENFPSKYVDARNIDVWLPDGYSPAKKYNVVYMHDGQMLFDSIYNWNHKEWHVDETFGRLIRERKIDKCIVVGIWNNGQYRHAEYFPQKFLATVSEDYKKEFVKTLLQNKPLSDNYLKFMVEELKPYIDRNFSTHPEKENTFVMGSSMGGMISFYAMAEYSAIFGGAAGLSIAWVSRLEKNFELPLAGFNYLQKNTPSPFGHKIYFDHGTTEMDTMYAVYQSFVDVILQNKGFNAYNYKSLVFKGTGHNETDWGKRLSVPVEFLMGKTPDQKASSGTLKKYDDFPSKYVDARNVDVWLPDGYSPAKKYAVLYMHDGQALYDSTTTWNKQAWEVDDVMGKLLNDQKIDDVIVVGIWNGGQMRHADYFPQKPYESLSELQRDSITASLQRLGRTKEIFKPVSDNYLKFMVKELKPFIDKNFSTYTDRRHTFVAGSSMGGLISFYAICEYPQVFGGAACLSTHWPGIFSMENNPIPEAFVNYARKHLPAPSTHKIYFDYGDQTLDALYPPLQKNIDAVMVKNGYTNKNWLTRFFPGENHSERAWHKRLETPVLFLLSK
jgi:enterochelin esterase-like enzyme